MGSYKCCICFTRKFRWKEAQPPEDVKAAFTACAEGAGQVGPEQLRRFLVEWQKETDATAADAERIVEQVRQLRQKHVLGRVARPLLNLEDFHHFLFSDELNPPVISQVCGIFFAFSFSLVLVWVLDRRIWRSTAAGLVSECSEISFASSLIFLILFKYFVICE